MRYLLAKKNNKPGCFILGYDKRKILYICDSDWIYFKQELEWIFFNIKDTGIQIVELPAIFSKLPLLLVTKCILPVIYKPYHIFYGLNELDDFKKAVYSLKD